MTIHVHNARTALMPLDNPRHVYVGRRVRFHPRLTPSLLANPFRLNKRRDNRDEVISQYQTYLWWLARAPGLNADGQAARAEFERLLDLARTGDLHLYCWCAPEACHADVIKAEIERRLEAANGS